LLLHDSSTNLYAAVDSFATILTSFASDTRVHFPNMTVPDFAVRGQVNNQISQALQLTFAPLVTAETKHGWEAYSLKHQGW
jgi:hypothetical protein